MTNTYPLHSLSLSNTHRLHTEGFTYIHSQTHTLLQATHIHTNSRTRIHAHTYLQGTHTHRVKHTHTNTYRHTHTHTHTHKHRHRHTHTHLHIHTFMFSWHLLFALTAPVKMAVPRGLIDRPSTVTLISAGVRLNPDQSSQPRPQSYRNYLKNFHSLGVPLSACSAFKPLVEKLNCTVVHCSADILIKTTQVHPPSNLV